MSQDEFRNLSRQILGEIWNLVERIDRNKPVTERHYLVAQINRRLGDLHSAAKLTLMEMGSKEGVPM